MRLAAERVQDEDVEVFEYWKAFGWDIAHVREVGGGAEAVAGDGLAAVSDRHPDERGAEELDGSTGGGFDAMNLDAGAGGVAVDGAEGVLEDPLDDVRCGIVSVESDAFRTGKTEWAKVVHAEDVVSVGVCIEDGIDSGEVLADGLMVEVRACVDEDRVLVVSDGDAGARAAIGRVGLVRVCADSTGAAERGNAHAGAGAEES